MVLPSYIIDGIIIWGYAERFVGFCLAVGAVGLVYLIFKFAYKASKGAPPASDNDENPKD